MSYQIDQSGKIEQTNKITVIAFSNGSKRAIVIPSKLKRQLLEVFRLHGFTSLSTYYLFSVGIYYLLDPLMEVSNITIDLEYPGRDRIIKQFLVNLLERNNKPNHDIHFARIGNHPPAHYAAKDVFDKKVKPSRVLILKDFVEALKKTDGRLRECLATLVDVQSRSMRKIYHKTARKSR